MKIIYWLKPWESSKIITNINIIIIILIIKNYKNIKKLIILLIMVIIINIVIHSRIDFFSEHILFINKIQHIIINNIIPIIISLLTHKNKNLNKFFLIKNIKFCKIFKLNTIIIINEIILNIPIIYFNTMMNYIIYQLLNQFALIINIIFWIKINNTFEFKKKKYIIIIIINTLPKLIIGYYNFFLNKENYTIFNICGNLLNKINLIKNQQISGILIFTLNSMMYIFIIIIILNFK